MFKICDNQKYICFDFETCSLSLALPENKPWQLSFITCTKNNVLERYNFFPFWENLTVGYGAAITTKFNYHDYLDKSSDPKEALDIFENYLYNPEYLIFGHNHYNFDFYIHKIYRELLGKKPDFSYLPRTLDTNAIEKGIRSDTPYDKNNRTAWMYKMSNFHKRGLKSNLGFCAREYEIPVLDGALHDGLYDVMLNYEIFKKQLWKIEI